MNGLVNPGMIVSKVLYTKNVARTFSGYGIKCEMHFYEGPIINCDIEHHIDLFDEKYPVGVYQWDGKEFTPIEEIEKEEQ